MANIKLTTKKGTSYPTDLQNLDYNDAIEQLNLLEQKTGHEEFESDRQTEDVLCLNYDNGEFELYEIEDED